MLDAKEEIWLNIFSVECSVGGSVGRDFPDERTPDPRGAQSGRSALAGSAPDAASWQAPGRAETN